MKIIKLVDILMKPIRAIVGQLTLPSDVKVCSLGDLWVESVEAYHHEVHAKLFFMCIRWRDSDVSLKMYPYNYMRIKQNWYGKWHKTPESLHKHVPLSDFKPQ